MDVHVIPAERNRISWNCPCAHILFLQTATAQKAPCLPHAQHRCNKGECALFIAWYVFGHELEQFLHLAAGLAGAPAELPKVRAVEICQASVVDDGRIVVGMRDDRKAVARNIHIVSVGACAASA